jgi:hypothetical protein
MRDQCVVTTPGIAPRVGLAWAGPAIFGHWARPAPLGYGLKTACALFIALINFQDRFPI